MGVGAGREMNRCLGAVGKRCWLERWYLQERHQMV